MLGAGVFVVWGPAAAVSGRWLLAAIALAAVVAIINAASTAQLAAIHPVAGGAYAYGGRELGSTWGFVAGFAFVVGKIASVAAMSLAIGAYAWPAHGPVVAVAVVALVWALNARGVIRTAWATTVIAVIVLAGLAAVIVASLTTPPGTVRAVETTPVTAMGVASAAALIFFAFAGYARLATLGEEVSDPARTIPRAVAIAVAIVVVVYLVLGAVLLRRPGVAALVGADSPLTLAVPDTVLWRSGLAALAALSAGGALVALMAGIGRTAMAMAREGDLPRILGRTSPTTGVPHVAEAVVGVAAIALAWWADLGFALAMSSASVLTYYSIANASAFAARGRATGFAVPRAVSAVGIVLCLALALSLDRAPMLASVGVGVLALGVRAVVLGVRKRSAESWRAPRG
jgi:APA family basic amino acid/polyamine antiporter